MLDLMRLFYHFNLIELSIGTAVGYSSHQFIDQFTQEIIMPLLSALFRTKDLINYRVNIGSVELNVGKILDAFLGYIILILLVIFLLAVVFRPMINELMDMKEDYYKKNLEYNKRIMKYLDQIEDIEETRQEALYGRQNKGLTYLPAIQS